MGFLLVTRPSKFELYAKSTLCAIDCDWECVCLHSQCLVAVRAGPGLEQQGAVCGGDAYDDKGRLALRLCVVYSNAPATLSASVRYRVRFCWD